MSAGTGSNAGEQAVEQHYGSADISARILAALAAAGKDTARLERADLAPFDEFHGGGIASTRDLAHYAGLAAGMHVLDVGCGIGGPARTLAAEFGCRVSGIDLTGEFVRAARMLTARVGLQHACEFVHGSGAALPWPDAHFDAVWSQNMLMNVADKAGFFAEVARVLKPGGRFAFECVLAGSGEPLHLPCFWATRAELSHLVTRDALAALLAGAALELDALDDTTAAVIAQGHKRRAAVADAAPTTLSIAVIVPDDVSAKMDNALRNNEEGRTRTVKGICRRTG
ncbi:MAG: class I SAM-dependent methyltransferase [Gammaproteobacteria bacterium]